MRRQVARPEDQRPKLLFFCSSRSGQSRRVEGFMAQVLQRNGNHDTFSLRRIDVDTRADLVERFRVEAVPALLVADEGRIRARIEAPKGAQQIREALLPWLRRHS